LFSIKLQEMACLLIDGGGFAALHLPGMFELPAPAVSSRIVSSQAGSDPETPFRAADVSERAKLCQHGRRKDGGHSRNHPSWNFESLQISVSARKSMVGMLVIL
jgi:hypothetical protein